MKKIIKKNIKKKNFLKKEEEEEKKKKKEEEERIKKEEEKKKKLEEEEKRKKEEKSKDIDEAENYDADTVLTPDLWQVYANVKAENADFKSDIFNKNIDHLLENIGNFDSEKIKHNFNMDGFPPLMKNILTPSELLDKYTKKASQI